MLTLSEPDMRVSLIKLANFEPMCQDDYGNQLLDYLVLDALATYGPLFQVNPTNIREHIQNIFFLDFAEAEIVATGKRLASKKYILLHNGQGRFDFPSLQITEEIYTKITRNINAIQQIENEVINEWKKQLLSDYSKYPQVAENIEEIVRCFQVFSSNLFVRHGIECVNLLYPDDQKTIQWLKNVQGGIFDGLPKINDFIDPILKYEIPRFFLLDDPKRKTYIFRTFNSSFLWHLVHVDDKCAHLIRTVTKGQRLYLDNNVLYHLSGFDGGSILKSSHSVLRFARELGYDLFVTEKTIDEYHNSLVWRKREIKKKPPIPSALAKLAVQYLPIGNFMTTYWQELADNGISIDEFIEEKSHVDKILDGLEITKTNDHRKEIEGSEELKDEMSILRQIAPEATGGNVIEHDAFHRVLISKIRGSKKYHFTDAVAWFLTSDSKLDAYDRVARRGEAYLPFCLTIDKWIQINRPFLTRTKNRDEYESSFRVLVTQPFIRAMISSQGIEKSYQEVLSRLSRYRSMNPELAIDIVVDRHFVTAMGSEEDSEIKDKKMESKFLDLAEQYKTEKEIEVAKNEVLSTDVNSLRSQNIELANAIAALTDKVSTMQENDSKLITNLADEKSILTDELRTLRKTAEQEDKRNRNLKKIIHWVIVFAILQPTIYSIWRFLNVDNYWISNSKELTLVRIALTIMSLSLALTLPLFKYWQFTIGTVCLAGLPLLYTVLMR